MKAVIPTRLVITVIPTRSVIAVIPTCLVITVIPTRSVMTVIPTRSVMTVIPTRSVSIPLIINYMPTTNIISSIMEYGILPLMVQELVLSMSRIII